MRQDETRRQRQKSVREKTNPGYQRRKAKRNKQKRRSEWLRLNREKLQAEPAKREDELVRLYGTTPPNCPYCGMPAKLHETTHVAEHLRIYWRCTGYPRCDARVCCHPGTTIPLGTLANRELREARMRAHKTFDLLFQPRPGLRRQFYQELAIAMELPVELTHIGMFDLGQCEAAAAFARLRLREIYADPKNPDYS